ncbi:RING-variant domain family protein [Babesia bovis T2Bo]|uniref:Seroreactive antigen BMN1-9B n=1 Tax=Babesia bovis TaxID=5865 RepID=A7ATD7_BABBO|nr:RING-variant domain family protein [Babesia bovis T2Bo]EDO06198.1 RING-variant domain family protein [Babesia bovis T2Bo]|eukprot:XP_001609766.1 seroreactive antigen BMN1-9B [Babesia bovis T2Bo]
MEIPTGRSLVKPMEVVARLLMYHAGPTELVDFEKCAYSEDTIKIKTESSPTSDASPEDSSYVYIIQNGRKLHTIAERNLLEGYLERYPLSMVLAKLVWSDKGCFLLNPDIERPSEVIYDCYKVINSHLYRRAFGCRAARKRMAHALKEGDRIVMGRASLLVRHLARKPANSLSYIHDLMTSDDPQSPEGGVSDVPCVSAAESKSDSQEAASSVSTDGSSAAPTDQDLRFCRICLEDEASGPLVVPCRCKGSMKYVHLGCIRTWVQGRLKIKDDEGRLQLTYFLQNLTCELCGIPYPSYLDVESVWTEFLGIEEPSPPYVILEPEHSNNVGLHVASLATQPVNIGRSGDSGIILHDISVSRIHATLHFSEGHFVIEDRSSKFGTILHIGNTFRIPIERGEPVAIKIGTDVLCIEARPERLGLSAMCCFSYNPNSVRVVL